MYCKTIFFLLSFTISVFCAGKPGADPLIRKQLAELGMHFNVTKENQFELMVRSFNRLNVLVTVESKVLTYQGTRWRHVYSTIRFTEREAPELMKKLYVCNRTAKTGAWEISPEQRHASFVCKIPANAGTSYLYAAISAAAEQCSLQMEAMEKNRRKKAGRKPGK